MQIACKFTPFTNIDIMGLNIRFLLDKRRIKSDNTYPLVMRIVYNRVPLNISTGYSVEEINWDDKRERIKPSSKISGNINRLNNLIHKKRTRAYDLLTKLEDEGNLSVSSLTKIRKKLLGKEDEKYKLDVYSFIKSITEDLTEAKRIGNANVYKGLLKKLESISPKKTLKFEDINYKFLKRMETLHYSKNNGAGGLSVYLRTLRAVYNRAIKAGVVTESTYPFKDYPIKNGVPNRRVLSEEELKSFRACDLSNFPYLVKARNLYLASFYLRGINWMDMALLKAKDIQGEFDRISYLRQKTRGKRFSIKINESVKRIMLSYLDPSYQDNDYIFPILKLSDLENQHYSIIENRRKRLNKNLKIIAKICEIPAFTIYSARHTYAMALKRHGAPTNIIQDSLGHTTEEMTQNYLDSFENSVIDEYDELII